MASAGHGEELPVSGLTNASRSSWNYGTDGIGHLSAQLLQKSNSGGVGNKGVLLLLRFRPGGVRAIQTTLPFLWIRKEEGMIQKEEFIDSKA